MTLTGTVQYPSERAVEAVVSGLIGVRNVRTEIGVVIVDELQVTADRRSPRRRA